MMLKHGKLGRLRQLENVVPLEQIARQVDDKKAGVYYVGLQVRATDEHVGREDDAKHPREEEKEVEALDGHGQHRTDQIGIANRHALVALEACVLLDKVEEVSEYLGNHIPILEQQDDRHGACAELGVVSSSYKNALFNNDSITRKNVFFDQIVLDRCGHVEGEYVDLGEGTRKAVVHGRQARQELAPRNVDATDLHHGVRRILALDSGSGGWWWRLCVCNSSRSVVCLVVLLGDVRCRRRRAQCRRADGPRRHHDTASSDSQAIRDAK